MQLSIIVPVYNMAAEEKLNHCMDSLLAQTVEDYEIIAVDDASTDQSLEILRQYEKQYPKRVRVIASPENKRQGGAKNLGLKAATGKWIGFIDSDDWITPDMYQKLIDKAEENGADLVGCDYSLVYSHTMEPGQIVINNTLDQTGELGEEEHKKHILRSGSMVVKIYLHERIKENHLSFPEKIFYEDNCAAPLWSMYFTHFERVEEPMYFYYTLPESTTHQVTWEKCKDRMEAGRLLLEESKKRGLWEIYQDELEYRFTELYYATTLFSYMYSGKKRNPKNTALLKKNILKYVPDFRNNPYYEKYMAPEDKKLIDLQMKSNFLFFYYYVLLFGYRGMRKKLKEHKNRKG